MTIRSAKLYQGEDKTPVYDYTDLMIWEESEFGTRAWQGEGSAASIVIRDPLGEQGDELLLPAGLSRKPLDAKNLFVIEVDSSTLYRGRVGIKNYSRDNQHVERYRQVECSLHDTNWDLDHIFVHQYARPSESDQARVQGLIASYLSASPRATTALNGSNYISGSNLVTLPAQTYNRTSPLSVLREISQTANKQFFVTGDAIGGGSLFYDGNDSTAYACTFTISDRESEVRAAPTTTFPPIWNVGAASTEDGSELASHLRLFYGTGEDQYVTASSDVVQNQYAHASDTITDDTVTDAANAQAKADSVLQHRSIEDKNYNVTIGPLTDAQVVLVKHGMTINIKARAIPDADDQLRLMRIVQCRYTTPIAGTWFAHLQLGRPWKMAPYGSVSGPVLVPDVCHDEVFDNACIDTFNRLTPEDWGRSEIACLDWQASANGSHSADGTRATQIVDVDSEVLYDWLDVAGLWDGATVDFTAKVEGTVAGARKVFIAYESSGVIEDYGPADDVTTSRTYRWGWALQPDGDIVIDVLALRGFVQASTATIESGANAGGGEFWLRCQLDATTIRMKAWADGDPEPGTWGVSATDAAGDFLSGIGDCDIFAAGMQIGGPVSQQMWIDSLEFTSGIACGSGTCIRRCTTGGPEATSGTSDEAAAADHDHDSVDTGTTADGDLTGTYPSPTVATIHAGSDHNQPVRKNSTGTVFERRRLNFIEGTNVTLTVADDAGNDEVDITVAAAGGGGGGDSPFEFDAIDDLYKFLSGYARIYDYDELAYIHLENKIDLLGETDFSINIYVNRSVAGGSGAVLNVQGGNGIVVPRLSADPSGGESENGQIYYDTVNDKFRGYANGTWVNLH